MITCRELADVIAAYLDGELPPTSVAAFEEHLAVCPSCVDYIDTYRETIKLGRGAFADLDAPAPADVPKDLVAAVLAAKRRAG